MSSTWTQSVNKESEYPELSGDISSLDAVIIGGGLAGSLSAYLLAKSGKKVALIDDNNPLVNSVTAYTTAFITNDLDMGPTNLAQMYGKDKAQAIWKCGTNAIEAYREIIENEKIDCDYRLASEYIFSETVSELKDLKDVYALSEELGLDIKYHESFSILKSKGALELPNQIEFHPIKFLSAIREKAAGYGAMIFDNTKALSITDNLDGMGVTVKTEKGIVSASYVVIATYYPFNKPIQLFAHTGKYYSYVLEADIATGTVNPGMYMDSKIPYHYFRVEPMENHDRIIIGGEDHRVELPINKEKSFSALESFLKELVSNQDYKIIRRWRSRIIESIDGLPYIGIFSKHHPRQLVATGFSGNGMQLSMVSAQILRDIVLQVSNSNTKLFYAGRRYSFMSLLVSGIHYTKEFFGGWVKNIFK